MNFYRKEEDGKITCLLCQHYCKIKEGNTGICGVNKNIGDKIECLVYGYPAVMHIDPIEKKPLYHFLPSSNSFSIGTVGCNFKCPFCQNWSISQEKHINKNDYYSPELIALLAKRKECKSISYTYNEPTIFYPFARDVALEAKKVGIKNVYVSNGFESTEVINDMKGIIDAINVDLKSFNASYYKKELKGDLNKILENLKLFKKNGIWLEITTLVIPTKNDSIEELTQIANFISQELDVNTPWHVTAFHPDYKTLDLPKTSYEILNQANEIGKKAGLNYVYTGNIGFENPTCCSNCGQVLIQREYFDVFENNLVDNNKCPKCNKVLEGCFDEE